MLLALDEAFNRIETIFQLIFEHIQVTICGSLASSRQHLQDLLTIGAHLVQLQHCQLCCLLVMLITLLSLATILILLQALAVLI
jgi:hypothetical protein